MKTIFIVALLLMATPILSLGQAQGRRIPPEIQAEQMVRQLEHERNIAYEQRDLAALRRIWADDLILITPSGEVKNKRQLLEEFESGRTSFESVSTDDVQIRVYGNTVVVTGRTSMRGRDPSGNINAQNRFTRVYVRRGGRWQMVSAQATRIAQR